ncbi:MAG TPA: thymidylate synthase [Gaiellaceae bacterium]|nr:thymidylate synthase [Gaiellaceae bacterium]
MSNDPRSILAADLSSGWLGAAAFLVDQPEKKAVHMLVRILDPTSEDPAVRQAVQELISKRNRGRPESKRMPDIETTRNTIFPARWASRHPDPGDLAAHYRSHYTKDGLRGFPGNGEGTYFGRIVSYPRSDADTVDESADQLGETVRKLRVELKGGQPKSSRYEINIYSERLDRGAMSFPCLAHVSVHLHERKLQMQAVYRNEYLLARGYGNFLGLAELQRYMAQAVDLQVGELLMTIGHAELDAPKTPIRALVRQFDVADD